MGTKLEHFVTLLVIASIILIAVWLFYEHRTDYVEQWDLLTQVRKLGEQDLLTLEITLGQRKNHGSFSKILNSDEVRQVQAFLKDSDIGPVGDHNYWIYECILTFEVKENVKIHFWGIIFEAYEWNKNDIFLLTYRIEGDLVKFYRDSRLVRVKGLGRWINENGPLLPNN